MKKEYIDVITKYTSVGEIIPLSIIWNDGRTFTVDKVIDIRRAASLKVGGQGVRYTCRISGKEKYMWLEDGKWFVEAL